MRYLSFYIITCLFLLLHAAPLEASVLSAIPVEPPPEEEASPWPDNVRGEGSEVFSKAVSYYKQGNYSEALKQFRALISRYQGSETAGVATLYAGSITFKMATMEGNKDGRQLMNAIELFQEGVRGYPDSKNIPGAIIEIGKIYLEMNLIIEARGSFNRVLKEYPSTRYAAEALYRSALTYERESKYREALSQYTMLSMRYAGEMERERIFGMGMVFTLLHEFGEAKRFYEDGLKRWPGYLKGRPDILFNYSECQFQNGEFSMAREGFLIFYNLYPRSKEAGIALNRVGDTYLFEQKGAVAEKMYMNVLRLFPESEDALVSKLALGDIKFLSPSGDGLYQDALKYYKEVEGSSGEEALVLKARYKIGKVREARGESQNALAIYSELLDKTDGPMHKEVSSSFYNLAGKIGKEIKGNLSRHDYFGVVKTYQAYYKNFIDRISDEELLMEIAEAHRRLLLYNEASDLYQKIIHRNSVKNELALFKAGELYSSMGDHTRAIETLARYIADYPKGGRDVNARVLMGESHYILKEYEKAANYFYTVMRDAPYRYPSVYLKLSNILQRSGQYEDGANILTDIIKHLSKERDSALLSTAYIALGNAFYGLERYQEALVAYRSGFDNGASEDESGMVQLMMGDCLLKLNKRDDAQKIFTALSEKSTGLIKQLSEERLKDIALNLSL